MAPVRHSHTESRTVSTPFSTAWASAASSKLDAMPWPRKTGAVQSLSHDLQESTQPPMITRWQLSLQAGYWAVPNSLQRSDGS
jgi:hypothetical protein